ncbi:hypothetical protein lerEdw1_006800 [Lerista edwardsae]|nr:hypothetical protein lerEdw1_006800 [Lerista edwardsae]
MSQEEGVSREACPPPNKRSALERQRRKRITLSCERLRKLLPAFDGRQDDMASILEMTVEYLQLAQEHLPKRPQSSLPGLPASAEQCSGPNATLFPASVTQPIPGDVSESTRNAQIPIREFQRSRSVQVCPKVVEVVAVEQRIMAAEGTRLLEADRGATVSGVIADGEPATFPLDASGPAGLPKPPEDPIALLREMEEPSPLLSSTSQRWLTRLFVPSGPPSGKDFLADGLKSVPPSGLSWSCSEPRPQEEMLHSEVKLWKDDTEFQLEVEGTPPSGTNGALLQPELVPWMSEQEMLLPELDPATIPGSPMLFEDQPSSAWDSKSSLHYLTAPEEMETGFLKMNGLLALDKESEL